MRVLVTRLDSEGDVLLAGPAIRAVAAGAEYVTLLCGPRGSQAARMLPGVDEVVVWRAPWIDPDPSPVDRSDVLALADALAARRLDRALVLGSFHQSPLPTALVLRMAGVPWIGATSVDYPGSLLDLRHRIADDVHEVDRALDLARAAGHALPAADDGRLRVRPAQAPELPFRGPYVVVHPGASVPARAWAPERHAQLVGELAGSGRRVVLTGAETDRELCALVAGPPGPGVLNLAGATTFAELAGVLAGADAVVVGNTGPAHLAAAVGTPVVSLFAPTVPAVRWHPYGVRYELLHIDVPCAGCRARECPVPGHPCIDAIEPADVLAALDRLVPMEVAA
jgi:ADP-heptose:LPS heptosyltransferase